MRADFRAPIGSVTRLGARGESPGQPSHHSSMDDDRDSAGRGRPGVWAIGAAFDVALWLLRVAVRLFTLPVPSMSGTYAAFTSPKGPRQRLAGGRPGRDSCRFDELKELSPDRSTFRRVVHSGNAIPAGTAS